MQSKKITLSYAYLLRLPNLVLIALAQLLTKYVFLPAFQLETLLDDFEFYLLLMATLSLAAAGNIINDVFDVELDKINYPKKYLLQQNISKNTAYWLYGVFNFVGVSAGIFLCVIQKEYNFISFFISIPILLYLYSFRLKGNFIFGNFIVSFLVGFSIAIVAFFELLPTLNYSNATAFNILIFYAFFAFIINFMREIIKDLEDIKGDYSNNLNTLPIAVGKKRTHIVVVVFGVISILGIFTFHFLYLSGIWLALTYSLLFIIIPILFVVYKTLSADQKSDYQRISRLLKFILLAGILSIGLFHFII
ncbi:MAG: geranylgeranylglycerol-phosphate geranylgeranyltransferase [Bacteroidota bacterium]